MTERNARLDDTLLARPIGIEIADKLEDAIIREVFAPGEKLPEVEICARFNVSRSPLREAFQILETRGLVQRKPRFGTRVTDMNVEALDNIATCRIPLEATCSRLLAERPDRGDIADLLDVELNAMRQARDAQDPQKAFEANVRMTALLHDNCGNEVLSKLLGQLDRPALRYRYRAYSDAPELLDHMIDSNGAMIDAIRSGQGDEAQRITARLVEQAWQRTRTLFLQTCVAAKA